MSVRCQSKGTTAENPKNKKGRRRDKNSSKEGTYLDYVLLQLTRTQLPFLSWESGTPESSPAVLSPAAAKGIAEDAVVVIEGEAKHLGMKCDWKQHFHYKSGAFVEELVNEDMHVWWGFDGKDCTWEVDFSGLPSILELDDKETSLLCTWIRNGIWLMPEIRANVVDITLAEEVREPQDWQLLREQSFGRANADKAQGTPLVLAPQDQGDHTAVKGQEQGVGDSIILEVQLKEGKVKARLEVCTRTWRPLDLTLPVCGDIEKTTYQGFASMHQGEDGAMAVVYPQHTVQVASGGGQNEYWANKCYLRGAEEKSEGPFDIFTVPEVPIFPSDTSFDSEARREIDYFQARSGHIVVKPQINGKDIPGMMILDTGASGFVITKKLADDLDLGAFGELYVAGVTQKVRSQFRRADSIQLGPVRMAAPLFMEMNIDGVVHGSPEPIVGILGYDFFRRCVVEMPPQIVGRRKILVHDPTKYEDLGDKEWTNLKLVANVPHIEAKFRKSAGGDEHSALFMLDSGAGGAGIMFHARASLEYDLLDEEKNQGNQASKSIRGIGGEASAGGMKVVEGEVSQVEISGASFENVFTLIAMGGGFDLSLHTAGMICADLMVQCRVVFDYARRRFLMIQE